MSSGDARDTLFWTLARRLLVDPAITRGTMMGHPCLRANGAFFASLEPSTGNLVLKLPAARVAELIASNEAIPFAPAGRVFREWAAIDQPDPGRWAALLDEARGLAVQRPPQS